MNEKLLLVIPPVVRRLNGVLEVEVDFSHNLRTYLANFSHVTFACPVAVNEIGIFRSLPLSEIEQAGRLSYIPLPYAYREDRYLRHYLPTKKLIRSEISKADFLIFSPHANFDWSTLAALQAIKLNRKYDVESDWVQESVQRLNLAAMTFGLNKIRKTLWMYALSKATHRCFLHSSLALLQGQDVFNAYKDVAPNPHKVLNVQVATEDQIRLTELQEKLSRITTRKPITISYAGRVIAMKGPFDWLKTIHRALEAGVELEATWFGDGSLLPLVRREVERLGIGNYVSFKGAVAREEIMARLYKTDIFLFCHKTLESPRCLGEALASGCPLVGYMSEYARDLVAPHGGGEFVRLDNWEALADTIAALNRDRAKLAQLVKAAAASGKLLDRDTAMQRRIDLIKEYLH